MWESGGCDVDGWMAQPAGEQQFGVEARFRPSDRGFIWRQLASPKPHSPEAAAPAQAWQIEPIVAYGACVLQGQVDRLCGPYRVWWTGQ